MTGYIFVPVMAALGYVAGMMLHELTHIAACLATRSEIKYIRVHPTDAEVIYKPRSRFRDSIVKTSTVAGTIPVTVACLFASGASGLLGTAFAVTTTVIYIPSSESDWQPVADMIK